MERRNHHVNDLRLLLRLLGLALVTSGVRHKVRGFWGSAGDRLAGLRFGGVVGRTLIDGAES